MENACVLCVDLVIQNQPHPALRQLPVTSGTVRQCKCCQSLLIQQQGRWKLVSEEIQQPTEQQPDNSAIAVAMDD